MTFGCFRESICHFFTPKIFVKTKRSTELQNQKFFLWSYFLMSEFCLHNSETTVCAKGSCGLEILKTVHTLEALGDSLNCIVHAWRPKAPRIRAVTVGNGSTKKKESGQRTSQTTETLYLHLMHKLSWGISFLSNNRNKEEHYHHHHRVPQWQCWQ